MDDTHTGDVASDSDVELPSDPDETLDALTFLSLKHHRLPFDFFEIKKSMKFLETLQFSSIYFFVLLTICSEALSEVPTGPVLQEGLLDAFPCESQRSTETSRVVAEDGEVEPD